MLDVVVISYLIFLGIVMWFDVLGVILILDQVFLGVLECDGDWFKVFVILGEEQ